MANFSCGFCGSSDIKEIDDGWICIKCKHRFGRSKSHYKEPIKKHEEQNNSKWYHDYLGYRGRLEDDYEQEAFDYEHEGYRESDL